MSKLYFPNCNGLRWIASIFVIIYHVEQLKRYFNMPNIADSKFLYAAGTLGIISFFVLSGFLITYLLLKEKEETNDVSFGKFYTRRILRLWPLYFFIVGLSLFVFPNTSLFFVPGVSETVQNNLLVKTLLFIFIMPNVAMYLFGPVPFASQTWSIGVEEQCYLIWPFIIRRFRNTYKVFLWIIVIYLVMKFGLILFNSFVFSNYYVRTAIKLWNTLSIDCMVIGGLAALVLYYDKKKLLKFFFNRYTQIVLYIIIIGAISAGYKFQENLFYEFYSLLFAVMILNLAANKDTLVVLENKVFNYLGKISYGLYMYHIIAIAIMIKISSAYNNNNIILYTGTFILTILISSISYELFESKFIKIKMRYSKVVSGDNARDEVPAPAQLEPISLPDGMINKPTTS